MLNLTGHELTFLDEDNKKIFVLESNGIIRLDTKEEQVGVIHHIPVMQRHPELNEKSKEYLDIISNNEGVIVSAQMVSQVKQYRPDLKVYTVGGTVFGENHSVLGVKFLVLN